MNAGSKTPVSYRFSQKNVTYANNSSPKTSHFPAKWHHKLSHSYSTCLVQHGCRKNGGKLLVLGRPADRVSGSSSPLSSLSSLSTGQQWAQFNTNSTQTQWHCPQHGPLNTTGKSTLWKLTGFRQTVSMRSFLFSSRPLYSASPLSLSPSEKSSPSPWFWNETTDERSLLQVNPPQPSPL